VIVDVGEFGVRELRTFPVAERRLCRRLVGRISTSRASPWMQEKLLLNSL